MFGRMSSIASPFCLGEVEKRDLTISRKMSVCHCVILKPYDLTKAKMHLPESQAD